MDERTGSEEVMGVKAFELYPRKCKVCGKGFESCFDWVYKTRPTGKRWVWFCSWGCLRKYEKAHPKRVREKNRGVCA